MVQQAPRDGQVGTAPDGTRVVMRGGVAVPIGGPEFPGFTPLGQGMYEAEDGGQFQVNRQGQLIRRTGTAGGDRAGTRNARRDFEGLAPVKSFREAESYYGSIADAVNASDGASDQVLIIAFNKMLDPDSVVREGEYDRARDIAGAFEGLRLEANRAVSGDGLTPRMRQQIAEAAQAMYEVRRDQYNDTVNRYQGLAADDGLNPLSVAREEFGGQRIAADPSYQEEGQANEAQVAARRGLPDYDRQAPLGTPSHPYVASPGVDLGNLPPNSAYIDTDGAMRIVGQEGTFTADGDAAVWTRPTDPADTPNNLSARGYVYDAASDTWKITRQAGEPGPGRDQQLEAERERVIRERRESNGFGRAVDATVRGVADGATFGHADEITAGLDTLIPADRGSRAFWQDGLGFGDAWRHNVELQRGHDDADNEDVQGWRRGGQAVGMVAGGSGLARAGTAALARVAPRAAQAMRLAPAVDGASRGANTVRLAQNAGRVAVGSAPMGALAGSGYTEGGAAERGRNALNGASAAALAGPVAGAVVSRLAPPVVNAFRGAGRFLGRNIGGMAGEMGVPGGNALAARSAAPDPLTGALDMFGAKTPVAANALNSEARNWRANNIEPTFFDVAGDGGQAIGRALATRQTPGRQVAVDFGAARRVGAQDRVSDIARRNISDDPRTASQVADALEQEQLTLSREAMAPIRDRNVRFSPETAGIFRTPEGRAAIANSARWTRIRGDSEQLNRLATLPDDAFDNPGGIDLSLGTTDRLRRSLNNQARAAGSDLDAATGLRDFARDVRRDAVSPNGGVPEYGDFLSGYAERAQLDEALDFGAGFMGRRGTEDFARRGAEMLPAQNQAARVAARDAVEEAGNTPAGAARVLDDLSVGRGRNQRADGLLGDDAARLRSNADYGRRELETGRNVSPRNGSPTNDNQQNSALANGIADGIGVARDVATGNKYGLATRAMDFMRNRGFSDEQAEALLIAGLDPARTDELIAAFMRTGATRREARRAARIARHLATRNDGGASTQR